ncbi:MAG TPA: cytochrome c oxidase assembly protein [Casimicrobiaceae bacterium]|jgi:cytochrome c oxidase assembly protein subunit 11
MSAGPSMQSTMPEARRSNRALVLRLAIVVVGMFAFGYALVPFYDQICKATGLRDIAVPDQTVNTQVDLSRTVRVEFDANLNKLPWRFRPLTPVLNVHPGEIVQVLYEIENNSDRAMTGQAVPSYGPQLAGNYFRKLDCFCFAKQSFRGGEKRQMPVVFVIDTHLPTDVSTITLSYTFFEVEGNQAQARDLSAPDANGTTRETPGSKG